MPKYFCIALFFITAIAFSQETINGTPTEKQYTAVQVKPDFPGGQMAFYKYISENYHIPKGFKDRGKLIARFVIEKDGSLTEIKILRDLGFGTGEELIRVLKNSPKWTPGLQDGLPVRVEYALPVSLSNRH